MEQKKEKRSAQVRRNKIRELFKEQESVSIGHLANSLGVSEMTIRRDLAALEKDGQIKRTHGGAIRSERMVFEFGFVARRRAHHIEKAAIATEVLRFIEPGKTIILDTGTTTLELAYLLRDFKNLTVITPSLAVASVLQYSTGVETILLGGLIRKGSPDLIGMVTEKVLDMFTADIAFRGADAIGPDGRLYNADTRIAKVDQKIREQAQKIYILADSSKIGNTALIANGLANEANALITDSKITGEQRESLEKTGTTIIIAEQS